MTDWLVQTTVARELLLQELDLPKGAYTQTGIIEPLLDKGPRRPPGDIDLIFVPEVQRAVAIQVKRIRVVAETTYRDRTPGRLLGNITELIDQANRSRELGFAENYALVLVQCDGLARGEYNFLARGSSPGVFRRIYHMTKDQPLHNDVGLIFVEVSQPTTASITEAGVVGICVDKRAVRQDQTPCTTTRVRKLVSSRTSL